jgi:hypothetical protein
VVAADDSGGGGDVVAFDVRPVDPLSPSLPEQAATAAAIVPARNPRLLSRQAGDPSWGRWSLLPFASSTSLLAFASSRCVAIVVR